MIGKGCADATFAVKSAIQTLHEHGQPVYALFVDLVKAFDSVNRELLWEILSKYGIPKKTIEVLKKLHTNVTYQFKMGKKLTKIKGKVGVKQGDNLGPILFIIMVNAVAETLNKKWKFQKPTFQWHGMKADGSHRYNPKLGTGTNWRNKGESFTFVDSYYVDDAVYLLLNREDLEQAAKLIKSHFKRFGLSVHCGDKRKNERSITEVMHIPKPGQKSTPEEIANVMLNDTEYFGLIILLHSKI